MVSTQTQGSISLGAGFTHMSPCSWIDGPCVKPDLAVAVLGGSAQVLHLPLSTGSPRCPGHLHPAGTCRKGGFTEK